jgi:hypothetical protein
MWIDHPDAPFPGHKFNGYYFKYPSEQGYQGLVSTIQDDPPMLNWLYVDKDTGMIKYGSRKDTTGHVVGPWGWSEDEQFLTFDEDDWRFIAVEVEVALEGGTREVFLSRDPDGSRMMSSQCLTPDSRPTGGRRSSCSGSCSWG